MHTMKEMVVIKIFCLFTWFLFCACDFYSIPSSISMPNEVTGGFHFQNCNSTPVPFFVNNASIEPDPVQMNLTYVNLTLDATITKEIGKTGKVDASLSIRLKTEHGETELCYILGERCYVSDVCYYLKKALDKKDCTIPAIPIYIVRRIPFKQLPFIVKGQFTVKANVREMGQPVACVEVTMCLNECSLL
ncbi:uncharacterized protein LOC128227771 isoform X1 [Mya arenaria]|uniref:uncharacterized protein LOC128227100 isoform X1 n=1 Tax=Mya arenaria TaxID=6604 RepID=UPI0022E2E72E|nr:uncharacterized protein LOC128227100 isoform X1 [Mya arenaria]XP_052794561.1 uncharacterized protein LOC128227771 isoform X1 [Mya arenaria]